MRMHRLTIRSLMLAVVVVAVFAGGIRDVLRSSPSAPLAVLTVFALAASVPILLTLGKHRR